jgi:predicted MFS family arabinose efflux permease
VLTRPVTLKLTFPNLLIGFGAASLIPYMNVFFNEKHAISDQTLGILFSLLSLTTGIGSIFSPRLEKLLRGKIAAVTTTQAISQFFLLLVGFSPRYSLAALGFLVRGTLMNMAVPLFDAFSMEQVPEQDQGAVNSLRTISWQLGWTIGPFLSGIVQVRYGFAPLFISTAALYSIATLLTWIFFHKSETPAPISLVPAVEAVQAE